MELLNLLGQMAYTGNTTLMWTMYIVAGLVGVWCWSQVFFWLPRGTLARDIARAAGAVLLLTPAPAVDIGNQYAPAFMVSVFTLLNAGNVKEPGLLTWWVIGLIGGALMVLVSRMLRPKTALVGDVHEEEVVQAPRQRPQATRIDPSM